MYVEWRSSVFIEKEGIWAAGSGHQPLTAVFYGEASSLNKGKAAVWLLQAEESPERLGVLFSPTELLT